MADTHQTPRDELLRMSLALSVNDRQVLDYMMLRHGGTSLSANLRALIRDYGRAHHAEIALWRSRRLTP